jgi:hypothetical protein
MSKKFKSTKVNYYQIRVDTKNASKDEINDIKLSFKNAIKFDNLINNSIEQGDGTVSAINSKEINKRYLGGALIYTQKNNIPPKFDESTQSLEAIDIDGFSGLGYDAAFFYDSENMILAIESKVPGPTLESFNNILKRNFSLKTFENVVVTSTNDYDKFINSKGVRTLEIKMLNIDFKPTKNSDVKGVRETTSLVEDIQGNYIELKISVGTERDKFLDFNVIKRYADFAMKSIGLKNEVTKFKVDIVDLESGKIDPIDLITNRVYDTIKIEQVITISKFSVKEKIDQIEKFYLKRRPQIEETYSL